MLKSPLLFAISILVALLSWTSVAKAAETAAEASMELSFALPPAKQTALEKAVKPEVTVSSLKEQPQKEQSPKKQPPKEQPQKEQSQSSDSASLLLGQLVRVKQPLPPISAISTSENLSENAKDLTGRVTSESAALGEKASKQNIGVQFLKDDVQMPAHQQDEQAAELPAGILPEAIDIKSPDKANSADLAASFSDRSSSLDDWIFEGGSGSLVAHAVGSAEGTRQWNGERTRAYYGHTDPGNGVWNLGTFSYQHEASSPEDADDKQIKRLKVQGFELEEQATQQGIKLSLPEKLNGLDLANQAPLAALGKGGYIERLAQAHRLQLQGEKAISWARTQAYIDPVTQSWNAPGLGNNIYSISKDQERRISAIDKALRAYQQTDENSLALANLKDISLEKSPEKSQLDDPGFDSLTEAFKVGDRPTHPPNPANRPPAKAAADIGNLEASSEVTFTRSPSASTNSHSDSHLAVANVTPLIHTVPANEEVLASIVPSTAEPSSAAPSTIKPPAKPAVEPEALTFDATNSEATSISEPQNTSEPAASELSNLAELPSAIEKPLIPSASDKVIPLEAKLDTNKAAKALMEIATNSGQGSGRGDRPAPNRSWWRVEDKTVQEKVGK